MDAEKTAPLLELAVHQKACSDTERRYYERISALECLGFATGVLAFGRVIAYAVGSGPGGALRAAPWFALAGAAVVGCAYRAKWAAAAKEYRRRSTVLGKQHWHGIRGESIRIDRELVAGVSGRTLLLARCGVLCAEAGLPAPPRRLAYFGSLRPVKAQVAALMRRRAAGAGAQQ